MSGDPVSNSVGKLSSKTVSVNCLVSERSCSPESSGKQIPEENFPKSNNMPTETCFFLHSIFKSFSSLDVTDL